MVEQNSVHIIQYNHLNKNSLIFAKIYYYVILPMVIIAKYFGGDINEYRHWNEH